MASFLCKCFLHCPGQCVCVCAVCAVADNFVSGFGKCELQNWEELAAITKRIC